jgi:hypothetical protein
VVRAVFDTNLWVSYLLTHRPPIATLIDRCLASDELVLVTAPELLAELQRVLAYPRLQHYYAPDEAERFIALVLALSELVQLPDEIPHMCRDRDDDFVIACAVAGRADVIASGDRDLLALGRVGAILIVKPAALLARLEVTE